MRDRICSYTGSKIYQETRHGYEKATKVTPHEVLILRGGFAEFQAKFKVGDLPLVEETEPKFVPRMTRCLWRTGTRTFGPRWRSGYERQPLYPTGHTYPSVYTR
jgi:hypothetical protein